MIWRFDCRYRAPYGDMSAPGLELYILHPIRWKSSPQFARGRRFHLKVIGFDRFPLTFLLQQEQRDLERDVQCTHSREEYWDFSRCRSHSPLAIKEVNR